MKIKTLEKFIKIIDKYNKYKLKQRDYIFEKIKNIDNKDELEELCGDLVTNINTVNLLNDLYIDIQFVIEEVELNRIADERSNDIENPVKVNLDDLK